MASSVASSPLSDLPSDFENFEAIEVDSDAGWDDDEPLKTKDSDAAALGPPKNDAETMELDDTKFIAETSFFEPGLPLLTPAPEGNEEEHKKVSPGSPSAGILTPPAQDIDEVPTGRTSGRKRVAPIRLEEDLLEIDSKKSPVQTRRRAAVRGNFTAEFLLQNPKSKLTTIDLADLLSTEAAWTCLTREQQLHLISMFPGEPFPELPEDIEIPNIPKQHLKSNSAFRADVRLFQEDLEAGRYDPIWLKDAKKASEERARGKFDTWKEKNREEFWGQKQKVKWNAAPGGSNEHSLATLVAAGYFEVGDVWTLNRGLREKGKAHFTVEKEAMITAVRSDYTLTFSFPPGQHKFSSPLNGEDITVTGINGPKPLSDAILNEDGRIVNVRGANAWFEFRCYRRNQDIGGLWDLRELYHSRQQAVKRSK